MAEFSILSFFGSIAMTINVLGTLQIIELCRQMDHLKSFVYVSTAFSASHLSKIDESFEEPVVDPYEVLRLLEVENEDQFNTKTCQKLIGGHPNTYTFTKSLCESLIRDHALKYRIPSAIARPSIICCPSKEPIPCYIDALSQGAATLVANVGMGLNRVLPGDPSNVMPAIPVDKVANSIIIVACETALDFHNNNQVDSNPKIYGMFNISSNQTTLGLLSRCVSRAAQKFPSIRSIRPPTQVFFDMNFEFMHKLKIFYFNIIFAHVFDLFVIISGRKPR